MGQLLDTYRHYIETRERCLCQKEAKTKEALARPFVTISRQTGAGGISVGTKLVEYFKKKAPKDVCEWSLFDKNIVNCVLEEHNLPKDMARFMSEEKISETQDIIETMFELHPPAFVLVKHTAETLLHLAHLGNAILVGRGGNLVTRKLKGGIHVRLIGSKEQRIKHAGDYYDLDHTRAAELIQKEDKNRKDYIKQNYGRDIDDPMLYDLVINTDKIGFEEAAQLIGDAVLACQCALSGK